MSHFLPGVSIYFQDCKGDIMKDKAIDSYLLVS
jgi:hypothetical protein